MATVKMTKAQSRYLTAEKCAGEEQVASFRRNLILKQAELTH